MISVKVKSVFSVPRLFNDIKAVLEDQARPAFMDLAADFENDYKDRLTKVKETQEDEEVLALMGGFIDGVLVERVVDGDLEKIRVKIPNGRLARLFEYGSSIFPATGIVSALRQKYRRRAYRIYKEAHRRIVVLARSASSQIR